MLAVNRVSDRERTDGVVAPVSPLDAADPVIESSS
jgi:hypothetical protein